MPDPEWIKRMYAFNAAHGGAMQAGVFRRADMGPLLLSAAFGELESFVALRNIGWWLAEARKRAKARRFLCVSCDTTFHAQRLPDAFIVVMPFASESMRAVVGGICQQCFKPIEHELTALVMQYVRHLYPDARITKPGVA